ncbi:hypothetical protein VPH35_072605 [Triticum aestivum]|uniref:Amino acid transporter transmembrane domain-containing protein n=1 Tax=Triticum turgidum subsp. durum TaxID=4567 RepID=A0A9R0T0U0_TRITD|nr:unnamed protein product [Triticum turgidum subsp. durum]
MATPPAEKVIVVDANPSKNGHGDKLDDLPVADETSHQIGVDPWYQVAFVLTTGVNSAYVLGYSGSLMVPLGWVGGTVGLLLAAAVSMYANALLGRLHLLGGKRHIRYRDLAGHIYGPKMYKITWAMQYINLFMINTGFIIIAGQALKALYLLVSADGAMKLPYCIAVSGFVCALFAFGIPYLSALRIWLGFSTIFSLTYIFAACVLSLKDGFRNPPRDYSIQGDPSSRVFTTIGAAASLVFAYNTGMLPEIQATVQAPVVKNMEKALWFQFTAGSLPLYAIIVIGYWAYGNQTTTYLLNNVTGPLWIKAVANLAAFLQTVIALHVSLLFFFSLEDEMQFQSSIRYFLGHACRSLRRPCTSTWTPGSGARWEARSRCTT